MTKAAPAEPRPYHHGNLRRVLLDAALDEIRVGGAGQLNLRALARRAGVSHAAPAHHFGDKAGLLTSIATEGYALMGAALADANATGGFLEIGLAYLTFSIEHPAHFEVMYQPDLYRSDDPELLAARTDATRLLFGPASEEFPDADAVRIGIAGWSFVHGFASLWAAGNLQARLGDDPIAAAADVAQVLFGRPRD